MSKQDEAVQYVGSEPKVEAMSLPGVYRCQSGKVIGRTMTIHKVSRLGLDATIVFESDLALVRAAIIGIRKTLNDRVGASEKAGLTDEKIPEIIEKMEETIGDGSYGDGVRAADEVEQRAREIAKRQAVKELKAEGHKGKELTKRTTPRRDAILAGSVGEAIFKAAREDIEREDKLFEVKPEDIEALKGSDDAE